jgi:hypothetical protein
MNQFTFMNCDDPINNLRKYFKVLFSVNFWPSVLDEILKCLARTILCLDHQIKTNIGFIHFHKFSNCIYRQASTFIRVILTDGLSHILNAFILIWTIIRVDVFFMIFGYSWVIVIWLIIIIIFFITALLFLKLFVSLISALVWRLWIFSYWVLLV